MKKLNLFLVAIFMIAFVGCQNAASTIDYLYTEHEHNWVEFVPTSKSVIGESSPMKCSLCGIVCVHEIEHTDEPTCTKSVLLKCKCGKVTHNVDALGHDFGDNLEKCNRCGIVNPNYVEQPPQTYTCNGCNTVYDTETEKDNCNKQNGCPKYVEPIHEHNFVKVSDATCTEPSTEKCECGEVAHNVPAGHSKDNGTVTKAPTCYSNGEVVYKCIRCNFVVSTENVEKVGHSYQDGRCIHCGIADPSSIPNIEDTLYLISFDILLVWIDGEELALTNPVKEGTYRTYFLYKENNKWAVIYDTATKEIINVI